jgi:hypothetical protein
MLDKKEYLSLSFILSLVAFIWGVFTWWDAGGYDEEALEQQQQRLLTNLVEETRQTRLAIISASNQQLALFEKTYQPSANSGVLPEASDVPGSPGQSKPLPPSPAAPDPVVKAAVEPQETPRHAAVGKVAWIFVGRFISADARWDSKYNKTIENFTDSDDLMGQELVIAMDVGFNTARPRFPSYENGLNRVYPYSLGVGSRVKVLAVDSAVGWRRFTWAQVEVLSYQP